MKATEVLSHPAVSISIANLVTWALKCLFLPLFSVSVCNSPSGLSLIHSVALSLALSHSLTLSLSLKY